MDSLSQKLYIILRTAYIYADRGEHNAQDGDGWISNISIDEIDFEKLLRQQHLRLLNIGLQGLL